MEEQTYILQRTLMVEQQLKARGIRDEKVLAVFNELPRHLFVSPEQRQLAYGDHPLALKQGQTISQPYIVALMTESLKLSGHENVLEIGTGSGYQTAILAELAARVYTIERLPALAEEAEKTLQEMDYKNISFKTGDGTRGWPEKAPFDGILAAAAPAGIPPALLEQLTPAGGRLVMPLGATLNQKLVLIIKDGENITPHTLCDCRFVPLIEDDAPPN